MPDNRNHLITYIGAVLLIVGAFAPLATIPVVGDISYYDLSNPEVFLVIILAALGPGLIMMKKELFVPVSAAGVWLVLLWPAISNMGGGGDSGGLLGRVTEAAGDPLQKFASELFSHIDEFSWGGYLFLLGLVILTAGCIMTFLGARKGG